MKRWGDWAGRIVGVGVTVAAVLFTAGLVVLAWKAFWWAVAR